MIENVNILYCKMYSSTSVSAVERITFIVVILKFVTAAKWAMPVYLSTGVGLNSGGQCVPSNAYVWLFS